MAPKTMFEKIWDAHVVSDEPGKPSLLYVDLHLVHEITSAQAFDGLRMNDRKVRRGDKTVVVADHNVPTKDRDKPLEDEIAKLQLEALANNTSEFGLNYFDMFSEKQGIVHVIGPEQGWTQPGMIIVCGDSHTSTHGAVGAMAFGIGTSEVEHVLATQCIWQAKPKTMEIRVDGTLTAGVTPKDVALGIIGKIGTSGGIGHAIEYTGSVFRDMSMEGRMTVCNMSIEAGARAGLIAPDSVTFEYLEGRQMTPKGGAWEQALANWQGLPSDDGAAYDREINISATDLTPYVTWGTSPQDALPVTGMVPDPAGEDDVARRASIERSLLYMDLAPGTPLVEVPIDRVFIGSCTNGRIEDLREVAAVASGRQVARGVGAMIVPGSGLVKEAAEAEGLDKIFIEAGFEWRDPGCSMCLAMNADRLEPGQRCASTSNRNFEGRQGRGGRTHLMSPAMAAAAAVTGHITDVRDLT